MSIADQHAALSRKSLRRALRAWDSVGTLGAHPLAELGIVEARRESAGYSDTPAGRGLALREVLRAAVEAIRPEDETPNPAEKRWRPYIILTEQYLHGRAPDWVAAELSISERTYYEEQERAMRAIADIFCQWEEQSQVSTSNQPDANQTRSGMIEHHVPFLAPPRPAYTLVGRDELLGDLKRRLLEDETVLIALQGLPGVGKTALAIELAHAPEIRARFCDGVLWAGLGRQPDVLALLGTWATAMQVPAEEIARRTSPTERAWGVHAAIGLRRMLLVIDDAWQVDAALVLKVGGPNCACVVTTRLANVALDLAGGGSTPVRELDVMEGVDLLAQLAPKVVCAEPEETQALVRAVGGLPLALILMGRHLRKVSCGAQRRRVREALAQLQADEARLQLAQPQASLEQSPDLPPQTPLSLQVSIGLSDMALDAAARQALRNLSLFPPKPNTFSEAAALAVIDTSVKALDALADHGLLESVEPDRYTLHQTISDYARLEGADSQAAQRFVNHFVQCMAEHADDNQLLDLERNNLLTALELAFLHQMCRELIRGVNALHPFLMNRGLYAVAEIHLSRALNLIPEADYAECYALLLAREKVYDVQGRREAQCQDLDALEKLAGTLNDNRRCAEVALRRANYANVISDYSAAIAAAQRTVELAQTAQNVALQTEGHWQWGRALGQQGNYAVARAQIEQALALAQEARTGSLEPMLHLEATCLSGLGSIAFYEGDYAEARTYFEQSGRVWGEVGSRWGEYTTLGNLGVICRNQGDYAGAQAYYEQLLRISHEVGDRWAECTTLNNFGFVFHDQGDYARARAYYEQSLCVSREIGERRLECITLEDLALLFHQTGDNEAAREHSQRVIRMAIDIGARPQQGHGLINLGRALEGLGQWTEATIAYRDALDIRRDLGQHNKAMESLAGLARVSLAQGDLVRAQTHVEEILSYLQTNTLDGMEEPFRMYLTCYQVLKANADPRAQDILTAAYNLLQARAAKISDEKMRRSFLENVPTHWKLIAEWAKQSSEGAPVFQRPVLSTTASRR